MLIWLWLAWLLVLLFLVGSCIGSFLNVCIARLPAGQSLFWPPSRCGQCSTLIRSRDNLPLLSYWLLRGRCRNCGAPFSMRYFWVELTTGLAFVLLFLVEIGWNIHRISSFGTSTFWYLQVGFFPEGALPLLVVHLLAFCLLLAGFCCNLERQRVPGSLTLTGLLLAALAGVLFPWPWPHQPAEGVAPPGTEPVVLWLDTSSTRSEPAGWLRIPGRATMPADQPWSQAPAAPRSGVQLWPFWGPLPDFLPAGSWPLGLANVLAGALAAGIVAFLFRLALLRGSPGEALRHGDVRLALLGGAFLGWQPALTALLAASIVALVLALLSGRPRLALSCLLSWSIGPALLLAWLGWPWLGPALYPWLFSPAGLGWLGLGVAGLGLPLALFGQNAMREGRTRSAAPLAALAAPRRGYCDSES